MDDDAARHTASAMVISPTSASHHYASAAENTPTPASSSRMSTTFDFTSGPSDDAIPSFDPAIAAFADMSFTRPPLPSPYLHEKSSLPGPAPPQQSCFRPRDLHDKKRIKVDPETPALDSIDYWIQFDNDVDKMGSFEIDYSKRNEPTGLNGASSTMPGLGSGLYSTAMAPFREEDFIDDTAFDPVLSDDEDMFDTAQPFGEQPSSDTRSNPTAPLLPPPPPLPPAWDRAPQSQSSLRLPNSVATEDVPRPSRRDIWDALPRGTNQVLSPDEHRRLLEIALNSGRMPGSFIPPNGFGIGFGAGLGARAPAESGRSATANVAETDRESSSAAGWPFQKAAEARDRAHLKQQSRRHAAATRPGASRRPFGQAAAAAAAAAETTGKPKSADRVAHNDVERKYRTNLKVKIAELRDAVPALQSPPAAPVADCSEGGSAGQQHGAAKVSKGTVLTKATEYIQQLEQRNRAIMLEHQQLARRLQAFETLFNSAGRQQDLMPNHSMTLFDPRGFC